MPSQARWVAEAPQPDMGVEEQFQSPKTSQSSGSLAGETISPIISMRPFINPSQSPSPFAVGGTTSATGMPRRVMTRGCLVFPTSSSIERHFALNLEMATCFTLLLDHGQHKWSITFGVSSPQDLVDSKLLLLHRLKS